VRDAIAALRSNQPFQHRETARADRDKAERIPLAYRSEISVINLAAGDKNPESWKRGFRLSQRK